MHYTMTEQINHETLLKKFDELNKRLDSMESKIDPMYQIFSNAKGFGDIAATILKALVLVGAGVAVIVGFIKYLKQ